MSKRYLIFISSTYEDLKVEREKVISAVLELKHIPSGMEQFPSVGIPPMDLIKKVLKECDYYILIIGARYGSLSDHGISYTEEEYNYAVSLGIPVIAFFPSDPKSFSIGKTDNDDNKRQQLEYFKNKIKKGGITISYWNNPDHLKSLVLASLPQAIDLQPRDGWVRARNIANVDAHKEIEKLKGEVERLKSISTSQKKLLETAQERINQLEHKLQQTKASIIKPFKIGNVAFNMVYVSGGTFRMGETIAQDKNTQNRDQATYEVTVSDFWIGETPVTQALWLAVRGNNPSKFSSDPNLPVERVSLADCKRFIDSLNTKLKNDLTKLGLEFRLPTEEEWEFAARGGNIGRENNYIYSGSNDIEDVAWYNDNSTHPVAKKSENELGLFDMSGNVWERCHTSRAPHIKIDEKNLSTQNTMIVFQVGRGGSWSNGPGYCEVTHRMRLTQMGLDTVGLRLVLSVPIGSK